jgi:ribosomal protein S12 methylthiotransferase accessory factor
VDLASVDDPACRWVLERFENAGIAVAVWDVTSDVGIASFLCSVADRNPNQSRPLRPIAGSGCHPRREIALLRALTEAAQGRLTTIAGSRDDLNASVYDRSDALDRLAIFFRELGESEPRRPFSATPTRDAPSFLDDFEFALESLSRAGARQVVAVDLSRAEIGIPVVRIVVPGLEAMSETPHYTPGPRARRLLAKAQ